MRSGRLRLVLALAGAVVAFQLGLTAQAPAKRPISYDVMDYWRSIQGPRISADGQWLAYALTAPGDDGELVVRNIAAGQDHRSPRGTSPVFTPDGRFVIFTIVPPRADDERANRGQGAAPGGAPPAVGGAVTPGPGTAGGGQAGGAAGRNGLGIMSLATGQVTTIDQVGDFKIPEDGAGWLAYRKARAGGRGGRGGSGRGAGRGAPAPAAAAEPAGAGATTPAEKRPDPGSDLIVRNLTAGTDITIADVTDYAWDRSGALLAYAVSAADAAKDGVFVRHSSDGSVATVREGKGNYHSLIFDKAGKQLAFLSDQAEFDAKIAPYRLYLWTTGDAPAAELVSAATRGMVAGFVVSDNAPRFSDDGARLFLSTAPAPAPPPSADAKPPVRVDVWSYKDPLVQPNQQLRAQQDRNRSYSAIVVLADKKFVQLATKDLPTVNAAQDPARALGTSGLPYEQEISWDTTYNDVYVVDLNTGGRKRVLQHFNGSVSLSPGGQYVLYFDEPSGHWFTYRIADAKVTNLTASLPVPFANQSHDTPDLPPAIGSGGWTEGDRSVLLYDEFDIWEIRPDGTGARMITGGEGRKQKLIFRYRPFDETGAAPGGRGGGGGGRGGGGGADRAIPLNKPLLLSTTNDVTRASGYYRVGLTGTTPPEKLMMVDKAVGAAIKAKNADTVMFTESRFDEFPDLWISDTNFRAPKKATAANPQQAEYVWGKAEKMAYTNADGKVLDALLIKPENFDPTKKYPLMVYIYEELSDGLHGYRAPNVGTSINVTRYVSNGYIVLEPDIVYETGYPGPSAMKCVIPAINSVLAQGYIDPKRIGIQGHSWGGYQITYMITQTNIFAAVEAGAAVSNMISAYGGIRWGTGVVREMQYEKGQSRIGAPPWDAPLQFIENSPIFWIERIHTPYLTIHNDADTAVPWQQGIEFSTAMRRLGKESYMFTFNGEAHGLGNRDNQKYWTVHMDEFFDHYLLGKPRPEWMDKGVPFLERGARDVSPLFKRPNQSPASPAKGGGGTR